MADRKRCSTDVQENHEDAKKSRKEIFKTLVAFASRKGERADMQDAHVLMPIFDLGTEKPFLSRCSFFAIFDGHAGPRASEFCQKNMGSLIKQKLAKSEDLPTMTKSIKSTFVETYKSIDDQFLSLAKQNSPIWKDGTTASTLIILNNTIYVANIGDSKIVVARKKDDGTISPVCLTVDHNPMSHEERMRIQKTGATVKDGRINGVIEVSRSIGDVSFKNAGVISTPDIKKLTIMKGDLFAIIACDGLWKSFTNSEAVNFASEELENVKKLDIQLHVNETREEAEYRVVAEKLASEAVRRKCGDNVSVILIKLEVVEVTE